MRRIRSFLRRIQGAEPAPPTPRPSSDQLDELRRSNRELLAGEIATRKAVLASHPTHLILDPATACNLACPFCPTGAGYTRLRRELLTPDRFDRIVRHLRLELLEEAALFNWGEPFLNAHVLEFVRSFSERRIRTQISTNLSVRDYDQPFFEKLVESRLTTLLVSIDGASPESYGRYRIGGSFERVVRNMTQLAEVKRARQAAHPHVVYKMLLNRFNESEIERAAEIAASCDAEFRPDPGFWCPDTLREEWAAGTSAQDRADTVPDPGSDGGDEGASTFCRQLWDTVTVNADGAVFPCCLPYDLELELGNLVEQDIATVRNTAKIAQLRRFVSDASAPAPDFPNICDGCPSRWSSVEEAAGAARAG